MPTFRKNRTLSRAKILLDTRGVSAVEFAILAPMLIFMAVATTDLGMGFYRRMQVESAAQAGAQYAMLHSFDATAISTAVTSATNYTGISASPTPTQFYGCPSSTGITAASSNSTCSTGNSPGTYVSVSAQATYSTLIAYPGLPNSYNLAATSTARIQ